MGRDEMKTCFELRTLCSLFCLHVTLCRHEKPVNNDEAKDPGCVMTGSLPPSSLTCDYCVRKFSEVSLWVYSHLPTLRGSLIQLASEFPRVRSLFKGSHPLLFCAPANPALPVHPDWPQRCHELAALPVQQARQPAFLGQSDCPGTGVTWPASRTHHGHGQGSLRPSHGGFASIDPSHFAVF